MAFEKKILGQLHCPRCNAIAELRVEDYKPGSETVLVFVVCEKCRYRRYNHRTTKKAIRIQGKIDRARIKLEELPEGGIAWNQLLAIINNMEMQKRKAERLV
jgi:C4-type Zn-finger protein